MGGILVFGSILSGQLSLDHNKNVNTPTLLMNNTYISSVSSVTLGNLG